MGVFSPEVLYDREQNPLEYSAVDIHMQNEI